MDLSKVVADLRAEMANLDRAIACLERIAQGEPRRGRPPGWLAKARDTAPREPAGAKARERRAAANKAPRARKR